MTDVIRMPLSIVADALVEIMQHFMKSYDISCGMYHRTCRSYPENQKKFNLLAAKVEFCMSLYKKLTDLRLPIYFIKASDEDLSSIEGSLEDDIDKDFVKYLRYYLNIDTATVPEDLNSTFYTLADLEWLYNPVVIYNEKDKEYQVAYDPIGKPYEMYNDDKGNCWYLTKDKLNFYECTEFDKYIAAKPNSGPLELYQYDLEAARAKAQAEADAKNGKTADVTGETSMF